MNPRSDATPPAPYRHHLRAISNHLRAIRNLSVGRPRKPGESAKAAGRRRREGFFQRYCQGSGLDIGYGGDLLCPNCRGFDIEHGDAHLLPGIPPEAYDFVYASHVLEHMFNPEFALRRWFSAVKPGGVLVLYVPHRDLYEKRKHLPSKWNPDHKFFFLLDVEDPPDTLGMLPLISRALTGYVIEYARVCGDPSAASDPEVHSQGEYSMEIVVAKLCELDAA